MTFPAVGAGVEGIVRFGLGDWIGGQGGRDQL